MMDTPDRIEPCFLESSGEEILDAQAELIAASTRLGSRLHPKTAASLAGLVRLMNTYYSNLIEGHSTHPRDIEQALADRLDGDMRNYGDSVLYSCNTGQRVTSMVGRYQRVWGSSRRFRRYPTPGSVTIKVGWAWSSSSFCRS
ncbi:hypothetical protein GALL_86160 [mine drainage metagenome]|uniref:Filamentation induced by cAMP protein Fic n=1 Tax=mine drainage metagenome TaxID=410659 RepID=A0A1J5SM37_9ZZZZ